MLLQSCFIFAVYWGILPSEKKLEKYRHNTFQYLPIGCWSTILGGLFYHNINKLVEIFLFSYPEVLSMIANCSGYKRVACCYTINLDSPT